MSGINEILSIADALDEVANLIETTKSDDGKISIGDVLRPAVWSSAMDVYKATSEAIANAEELSEEVFDLDAVEIKAVLSRYVEVSAKIIQALAS
jgi:hypothetical protein